MLDEYSIVLVLGGGNALGAYHGGGYEALDERGVRPDWVVGASTGAINGAIICGNPVPDRVARLKDYWKPASDAATPFADGLPDILRRSTAAAMTLAGGQPNVFVPSLPWLAGAAALAEPSLYDTRPLEATLERLVDYEHLNGGGPRFTATAVDLESGEPVTFDTSETRVEGRHIRASSALLPAFPPVEIDGRLLGDGGLAANLPVDIALSARPTRPTLCIALDLLPLAAPRPKTLGEAASRMQDLMFASQSRLALAGWEARYAARPGEAPVTVFHLSYHDQATEIAGKAFDFSPISVRRRWDAGYRDVAAALRAIDDHGVPADAFTVWRPATP